MYFPVKTCFFILTMAISCVSCQAAPGKGPSLEMSINVRIDTVRHIVKGEADTSLALLKSGQIRTGMFRILRIETEKGENIPFRKIKDSLMATGSGISPDTRIRVLFEMGVKEGSRPFGANTIGREYVLLMNAWCPMLNRPAFYRLSVTLDRDLVPVSEADEILEKDTGLAKTVTFVFDHPRESITVAAARFTVTEAEMDGVRLSVYLLKKRPLLARKILTVVKRGLSTYEKLLSPFPFKRFEVVENPAPSGITVPTLTLIGSQIIDKPFVLNTSITHELVHSWFGNSVLVEEEDGNWCEGLTTYMADYLIEEKRGKGTLYRHDILSDYKSYVHGGKNSFPLSEFKFRYDRVSKAIGYGKAAMVFHMLRKLFGDKAFFKTISAFSKNYRFKKASWKDIEGLFSDMSDTAGLNTFFSEWLKRKDVPLLHIDRCREEKNSDGSYTVTVHLSQQNKQPYQLTIPIRILTDKGHRDFEIEMAAQEKESMFRTQDRPRVVILDPCFDIMRDLSPQEFPPSLSRLLGAGQKFLVLPEKKELQTYKPAISFFTDRGFRAIERKNLKHSMLGNGAFLVLGTVSGRLASFCPDLSHKVDGIALKVGLNPLNRREVVSLLNASSAQEIRQAEYKILHYGMYSYLQFKNGVLKIKKRAGFQRGISLAVRPTLSGVFSKDIRSADGIIRGLQGYRVIYLGEKHDEEGIHQAQLTIIKSLYRKEKKLAVGMEMFQRPFQGAIDRYLGGKITERRFLKESQYFKRWAFNYHFYRPIIEFCRAHSIPVVALNLKSEISQKIAREGISGLSEDERRLLPMNMDITSELYRRYLKQVFEFHRNGEIDDFEHFCQAQIAWDETMAQSIVAYLRNHPGLKMVVIVGGGHVEFGYGIPSRVKKRMPDCTQVKALFNSQPSDPSKADLFLYAPQEKEPFTPKLGVILTGKNKLTVEEVIPDSPASQAGIKRGDVITKVGGKAIRDIYDLKVELFFKKRGEKIGIEVTRKDKQGNVRKVDLVTGKLVPFSWNINGRDFHPSTSK